MNKDIFIPSVFIVSLFIFAASVNSKAQDLRNNNLFPSEKLLMQSSIVDTNIHNEKSPLLSGALSFILPGFAFGQAYNGEIDKYGTHMLITTGSVIGALIFMRQTGISVGGGSVNSFAVAISAVCVLTFLGNWIYTVIDAPISSVKINNRIEWKRKYNREYNFNINPDFNKNKQFGLRFNINL